MKKTIAIDFDGCLCEYAWPEIGAPHMEVINAAIREREIGAALILWTCRIGERLEEAVAWCAGFGLKFDAVNANLAESIAACKADPRKVFADEYWDDRAVHMPSKPNDPLTLEELREMGGEPVYFQFGDGAQGWGIVEIDVDSIVLYGPDFDDHAYPDGGFINMEYNDPAGHFGLHLLGWRAYRRKPEEGET